MADRLRLTGKRIDHLERAYRREEIKILPRDWERQQAEDLAAYEATKKATLQASKIQHEEAVALKQRLGRLVGTYESFRDDIKSARSQEFEKRRRAAEKELKNAMDKRREEVIANREKERLAKEAEAERLRVAEERAVIERVEREEREVREAEEKAKKDEETREQRLKDKEAFAERQQYVNPIFLVEILLIDYLGNSTRSLLSSARRSWRSRRSLRPRRLDFQAVPRSPRRAPPLPITAGDPPRLLPPPPVVLFLRGASVRLLRLLLEERLLPLFLLLLPLLPAPLLLSVFPSVWLSVLPSATVLRPPPPVDVPVSTLLPAPFPVWSRPPLLPLPPSMPPPLPLPPSPPPRLLPLPPSRSARLVPTSPRHTARRAPVLPPRTLLLPPPPLLLSENALLPPVASMFPASVPRTGSVRVPPRPSPARTASLARAGDRWLLV